MAAPPPPLLAAPGHRKDIERQLHVESLAFAAAVTAEAAGAFAARHDGWRGHQVDPLLDGHLAQAPLVLKRGPVLHLVVAAVEVDAQPRWMRHLVEHAVRIVLSVVLLVGTAQLRGGEREQPRRRGGLGRLARLPGWRDKASTLGCGLQDLDALAPGHASASWSAPKSVQNLAY